jgi:UDP-N-acetylmuramyl pentapeptide phosphotransferase/UDP-N-acetylglucosamine-1-phosphate transferase
MILIQSLLFAGTSSLLIAFIMAYFFNKNNFLLDRTNTAEHKQLTASNTNNKAILCGGIIIFISSIFFLDNNLYPIKIFGGLILIVGILSDINRLNSPKIRILAQFFIALIFLLFYENLAISDLRITILNNILEIKLISILFTIFCILVLINGSNFLDGLNTLVVGYYILVLGIIVTTSIQFNLYLDTNIYYLIIFLSVVFIFNFFNKIYLGDAGSYLTAFFTVFFILDFFTKNDSVSPYFICLLLWYPAFENFFSIVRRTFLKKKIDEADQNHLHQMIYCILLAKNYLNKRYVNTATAILINLFNFFIFTLSYKHYFLTKNLIIVIFFNVFIYLLLYLFCKKKLNTF